MYVLAESVSPLRETASSNLLIYAFLKIRYNNRFVLYHVFIQYVIIHIKSAVSAYIHP